MSNYLKLYWLTRLDNINGFFVFLTVSGAILLIILLVYRGINWMDGSNNEKRPWIWFITYLFLTLGIFGSVLIPTKNEAIFIVTGGKVMDFAQNDSSLNKIPGQATEVISTWMDKELKKLKNEVDSTEIKK